MIGLEDVPIEHTVLQVDHMMITWNFTVLSQRRASLTSKLQHVKVGETIKVGDKPNWYTYTCKLRTRWTSSIDGKWYRNSTFISLLREPETYDLFDNITVTWTTRTHAEQDCYRDFLNEMPVEYISTITQEAS